MTDGRMPLRGSLVHECVRAIQLRIADGEWKGSMPGERRVAEVLQVGRDTVRLSLQQLEREGMLAPSSAGSRRRILRDMDKSGEDRESRLKIGVLAHKSLGGLRQPDLLEIDCIRNFLADRGGSLEFYSPGWYQQRNPAKALEALVAEARCSGWMLLRSSAAVQSWFSKRQIPALIRGYPHPGLDMPFLDLDWHAAARHAAGQLWRLGHRRVVVLRPPEDLKGLDAAVRGVGDLGEPDFEVSVLVEDGTPLGIGRLLARALRVRNPPSCVIATRPRQAASVLSWLASQGIRVPHHISLISLAWEPFLDALVPEMTCYRADPETVAKQVLRRLQRLVVGDLKTAGNTLIMPDAVKGASIGNA